jgi:hypothetical protein
MSVCDPTLPLLLRRLQERPTVESTASAHMTVVTTQGRREEPEMHDQEEDATRYDKD